MIANLIINIDNTASITFTDLDTGWILSFWEVVNIVDRVPVWDTG